MASKTLDSLTAASALDGTEEVYVVQSANSRKSTTQAIADLGTSQDNMTDGTTNKNYTATEKTKLAHITVAADIDLGDAVLNTATDASGYGFVVDEDDMASDSATKLPTQQSVKAYADTKMSAGTGVFDQAQTGSFYADETPPARIHRMADRLLVGDSVAYNGLTTGAAGSWLFDQGAGVNTMSWLEVHAGIISAVSQGGIGLVGAARNPGAGGAVVGTVGYAVSAAGSDAQTVWGGYFEAVREAGAGTGWGIEIDSTNLDASPAGTSPYTPYGAAGGTSVGTTIGIGIQAGGDPTVNPTTYPSDVAIKVGNNGNSFLSGLVFEWSGLYRAGGVETGRAHAISMAQMQSIDWYGDSTHKSICAYILSSITDPTYKCSLQMTQFGFLFTGRNDGNVFQVQTPANCVNYPTVTGSGTGAGVIYSVAGTDTNIPMQLKPKGSGEAQIIDGSFGQKIRVNTTGIGFYGAAPTAKPSITGALSTVSDAAAKAVLTSIVSALSTVGLATNSAT